MNNCDSNAMENEENEDGQFLVLGGEDRSQAVPLPLTIVPEWVADATIVSRDIKEDSVPLEGMAELLPDDVVELLKSSKITALYPVQAEVIPRIVEWNGSFQPVPVPDICISSPTGSGKTLCYVVPIVHFLRDRLLPRIRALVVLPTADLAKQVFEQFVEFTKHTRLRTVLITGRQKFQDDVKKIYKETERGLIACCDILVATPGRLRDHLRGPLAYAFCLKYVRFLVLDEVDGLLARYDLQWFKEVDNAIFNSNPSQRHKHDSSSAGPQLLPPLEVRRFRATASSCPEELFLAAKFPLQKFLVSATLAFNADVIHKIGGLFRPRLFRSSAYSGLERIGPEMITFPRNLDEYFLDCEPTKKPLVVHYLLSLFKQERVLCFTETLRHSYRLCELLRLMGNRVGEISGHLRPVERFTIVQSLNSGKLSAVVCTQIMARGISFDELGLVICYDSPRTLQEYAHMAGRTARAGKSGIIITLMSEEEKLRPLKDDRDTHLINRLRPFDIDVKELRDLMPMYAKALKNLKTHVDKAVGAWGDSYPESLTTSAHHPTEGNMGTETITVRMSRSDPSIIWGFRLQGGREFNAPLTISKVVPGSLAERAGLVEGDYIVRIGGRAVDQMQHRDAQDAIVASANDVELVIERTGSKIWRPTITSTSDHFSPVKYSLAHHEDMLQDDSIADSGFRSFSSGGGTPGDSRLTYGSQMESSFGSTGRRPDSSYQPPQRPVKPADSYPRETGGRLGTDSNLQKTEQPSFLHSETLRLIRETEGRNQEHGRGRPSGAMERGENADRDLAPSGGSIRQSDTLKRIMASLRIEPVKQGPRGADFGEGQRAPRAPGAPECYSCGRPIFGVFCKVSDNNYHGDCFKCSTCGTSLKNVGHYLLNGKLYCDIHARQQQQDLFRATGPQDPSIFSFRGAPPQPSPKQSEPPKAFYQPEVLKPTSSPIPHVHSAPLSPSSRGIPTHQVSKMPGSSLRGIYQEMETNRPPQPPPSYTSTGGGQVYQEAHSEGCDEILLTLVTPDQQKNHLSYSELAIDRAWSEAAGTPVEPPSLIDNGDPHAKVEISSQRTSDISLDLEPSTDVAIAREVICANLSLYRAAEAEVNGRTVGSYMPRRGRGILKQIGDSSRIPVCEACMREIRGPFVLALSKTWCPDHFTCSHPDCRRKLLDVGFVEEAGFIYCEFCFEKYLAPTCNKCQRAIVGDTLTAMERKWHPECFCCAHCHQPFGNSSFFLEEGKPFCEKDWNALFTTKCSACQFPIEAGDRWVEALGNAYHSNCFNCTICQRSLEGQNFYLKGGHPYCKAHA